jgi:hypothetical protein
MKFSLFRYQTGILYGMALAFDSISPDRGPSTGGVDFVIRGDSFQFPSFDDTFTGVLLDPAKWTDISTGSGSVTTGSSHLQLSSGTTLGSIAGISMISSFTNIQYEAKVNIPPVTINPTATVTLFQMQNFVDANNQANLIVELGSTGTVTLRCQVYLGGSLKDEYTTTWTTGVSTFKILRWNTDVYFYANGSLILLSKQGTLLSGAFRFFVDNRTTTYNIINTVVEYVINRPYVSFGDQVVDDLTVVSNTRARGLTPPSIDEREQLASYEGLVNVSVVSNITQTQLDFYEYYYEDSLTLLDEVQFDLKFSQIDDATVRTPTLSSRGLGGGK